MKYRPIQCPIVDAISHGGPPKKGASPVLVSILSALMDVSFFFLILIWFLSTWNHQCLGIWIRVGARIHDYKSYLHNVMEASFEYLGSLMSPSKIYNKQYMYKYMRLYWVLLYILKLTIHYINWMKNKYK